MEYIIATDGASNSRGAGYGVVVADSEENIVEEFCKHYDKATNNQMELAAVITALKFIKIPLDKVTIRTDSMYVIGCATLGWKRKKNVKLWELYQKEYDRASTLCSTIEFQHVRGHQGDKLNERCDSLATQ